MNTGRDSAVEYKLRKSSQPVYQTRKIVSASVPLWSSSNTPIDFNPNDAHSTGLQYWANDSFSRLGIIIENSAYQFRFPKHPIVARVFLLPPGD